MFLKLLFISVTFSLIFLPQSTFGASLSDGTGNNQVSTDPPRKPILTVSHWASSIWNSFSSRVRLGWDHVANGTVSTFDKVSTGVKGSWEQLSNKTSPALETVSSKIQDGWGVVANGTSTTFQSVSTKIQNGWEVVANGTVATYETAASRLCFIFNNLFCPSRIRPNIIRNETAAITTTAVPPKVEDTTVMAITSFNDSKAIQEFSCAAIKAVSIIGISMAGGLGVAIVLPLIFFLTVYALGFTGYGNLM